jgi:glycosyltransferase involved in cell wall biosynthesis
MTLSVLVPSVGRPSLTATLESIAPQLAPGDELLVDRNDDGAWGAAARNRLAAKAGGDFLLFMDDDDAYTPGALDTVRRVVGDTVALHIFRMRYRGGVLWQEPVLASGNVSTQMLVVPNWDLPLWTTARRDHDFTFAADCAKRWPVEWHEEVIARV